jgi:predicted  nucleic acid-binding Zn-ribbon protein
VDTVEVLKYALGLIQLLMSAWCWHMYNEIGKAKEATSKLEKELSDHKLHTSETYMTKTELSRAFDAIARSIEVLGQSMEARFERLDQKLDRKVDR